MKNSSGLYVQINPEIYLFL